MGFDSGDIGSIDGGFDAGVHDVDSTTRGASLGGCSASKTDNLIVRIAKKIWALYSDFQNMMFSAEIAWGAKRLISLADELQMVGDFLKAVPFLNIVLIPVILPHFIKGLYGKCDVAVTAFKVNYFSKCFKSIGFAIGSLGTSVGISKSALESSLLLAGVALPEVVKYVFKSILPPVLLVTTSIGGLFKTWRLVGCNFPAYVRYHSAVRHMDTDDGLRAFYDKVMGPKRLVDLTSSDLEAATKKADRIFKLEKEDFMESHASKGSRYGEIKALLCDTETMRRYGLELETLQGVGASITLENVYGPSRAIVAQLSDLRSLIESGNIWAVLDKEIEIYETILKNKDALTACLKSSTITGDVDALFGTYAENKRELVEMEKEYKALVRGKGAEVADAMCSEMHRVIFNNALTVLMAGLIISSSALALISSNYALYSIGLGLACGGIDMTHIIFDKTVGRKTFRKIDPFAYLSSYLHKVPTAHLNNIVAATA